jgi:hypothetical protein
MRVTRWQDSQVRKRSPEARECVDAAVRAAVDGMKADRYSTGEQCSRCGVSLRTDDDVTTDYVGRGMHTRCAPPA